MITTAEELLEALTLEPWRNLEILSRSMAAATGSSGCFIVSGDEVIMSADGSGELPSSGLVQIPVASRSYVYLRRDSSGDGWQPPATDIYSCLLSLIHNNIESYRIIISASTDKLTGVLNRKYLDTAIDRAFTKAKKTGDTLSIIICDLDFFKHVNDTYGHLTGDEVLRGVARVIRASIRCNNVLRNIINNGGSQTDQDTLGRYGGEEFVVLLEGADTGEACAVAERIRLDVQNSRLLGDKRDVTLSLGVATFPTHANTRKTLMEKADKALFAAKKSGRNRYMAWDESFSGENVTRNIVREIITGDAVKDSAKMTVLFGILDISGRDLPLREKLDLAFAKILDTAGAGNIALFLFDGDKPLESFKTPGKGSEAEYNNNIIAAVRQTGTPVFAVDWDNEIRDGSGMADWQSLGAVPVIKDGILKGVLYLSVSAKVKEFSADEAGFICNAGMLLAAYL
ncbi:MAG: GGDEF domain-containing protein [Defluviitaleaceae bacterium]|nr:GGDEF domain-containing protein [Defluviitaleaceae bacterium]MCL2836383.1 GGDEF domain-containing protein [Defluviitaleaceae bacterium]